MQVLSNKMHGFTTVELIVVIVVSGLMLTVILNTLGSYYKDNSVSLGKSVQETETRSVLRSIEKDLYNSVKFGADISDPTLVFANSAPFGSGGLNSNPWNSSTNGNGPVLIAYKTPTTQKADNDTSNTRLPVFLQPAGGCTDLSDATPALMAQIYFIASDPAEPSKLNLYRRTIVPNASVTPLCGTMVPANSSCAANSIASNPTLCRASDAVLLKDIKAFRINYFSPGAQTPSVLTGDPIADGPLIDEANSVEIEVETYRRLTNNDASNTNTASVRINRM